MDLTKAIEQYEGMTKYYFDMRQLEIENTMKYFGKDKPQHVRDFENSQSELWGRIYKLGNEILSDLRSAPSYTFLRMADGAEVWFHADYQREKAWVLGQNNTHLAVLSIPYHSNFSSVFLD
jgi:hypothetical protein